MAETNQPPVPVTPEPAAPAGPAAAVAPAPATSPPTRRPLDQYKVILHNDDEVEMEHVIRSLMAVVKLPIRRAVEVTMEAHTQQLSLVTVVHQELAELYRDQLASKGLTSTIEKA